MHDSMCPCRVGPVGPGMVLCLVLSAALHAANPGVFEGRFFRGSGDVEYLRLLDTARRVFAPDPEFQHVAMLYMPRWNGLVEGPTWDAWWVQNSYGPTYAALPFLVEPLVTFLQNSHDLWFDQMGDGRRVGAPPPFDWVAPDGCLCDAARPGWIVYRQGDGRPQIHDWGMEFTAAGLLMQSELLLIGREAAAIARYLPKLERCANFIETRRDPAKHLFLAGPAGNLLAPSFAGWKKPDGTYGRAYHAGLSVTYIAALDRLIELEKRAGRDTAARLHQGRRDTARAGLAQLTTAEGHLINSLDPDGTRHGVVGAPRHGYFEASPNHDAIAFRVVDDAQAQRIYAMIAGIPGLRPHHFILPNHPSYDDMYERPEGLWAYGTWVNGGHWSTCEARMILAYYRLAQFEDARRSMRQWLRFAEAFRLDNPLVKHGSDVYQPGQPINLTYDAFGPPAAFVRGLFEYLYSADTLTLRPHLPPALSRLEQRFPIRFGTKRLYLATVGTGPVRDVRLNGRPWTDFDAATVRLPHDKLPDTAAIEIVLGNASALGWKAPPPDVSIRSVPPNDAAWAQLRKPNLATNALPLRLGADSRGGSRFKGELAHARVFRRALTPGEIAALARGEPAALGHDPARVADWSFEELSGGTCVSRAEPRLSARAVGEVGVVEAPPGKAIRLDGSGYLEASPHPALNLTETCTLEARICPAPLPAGGGRILDKSEVGTSNGYLLDTYPAQALRLISQAGTLQAAVRLDPGRWVHVAGTVGADGRLALYVNGEMVAQHPGTPLPDVAPLLALADRLCRFHSRLAENGWQDTYEAAHARLALDCLGTAHARLSRRAAGTLNLLPNPVSQAAADQSYLDSPRRLAEGLGQHLTRCAASENARDRALGRLWTQSEAR
ncbi:MAG: hypothetical protein JXQ71_18005 [Verrucomicrobia bacterium]|nr:hypothetical protein [Verrucomicrobiota bacterium]